MSQVSTYFVLRNTQYAWIFYQNPFPPPAEPPFEPPTESSAEPPTEPPTEPPIAGRGLRRGTASSCRGDSTRRFCTTALTYQVFYGKIYLIISLRKLTAPQNRPLNVLISGSKNKLTIWWAS